MNIIKKRQWILWVAVSIIVTVMLFQLYFAVKSKVKILHWNTLQTQIMAEHPEIVQFDYKAKIPQSILASYSANVYVDVKIDGPLAPKLEQAIKNETALFLGQFIYESRLAKPKVQLTEAERSDQYEEFSTATYRPIRGINLKITLYFDNTQGETEELTLKGVLSSGKVSWEGEDPNLYEKKFDF